MFLILAHGKGVITGEPVRFLDHKDSPGLVARNITSLRASEEGGGGGGARDKVWFHLLSAVTQISTISLYNLFRVSRLDESYLPTSVQTIIKHRISRSWIGINGSCNGLRMVEE